MAIGKIIGRIAVKVLPDTTEFREKAANDLRKIQKELGDVEVDVVPKVGKAAKEKVKAELKEIEEEDHKVTFRVDTDNLGSVRRAMKRVQAEMAKLAEVEIDVELNHEELNALLEDLQSYEAHLPLELKVDKGSVASVEAALRVIEAELSRQAEVEMSVHLDRNSLESARRDFTKLAEELKNAGKSAERLKVGLGASVDILARLSGLRYTFGLFRNLRKELENLDKKVPLIASITLAILGLTNTVLSSTASIFSLSRALAQIGPAALLLPGLFSGMAIGLAATVVVFRDFNKELPGVARQLKAIRDSMSERFWAKARKPMQDMVDKLLPALAKGLDGTADALGGFFANLSRSLTKNLPASALMQMFHDLNASITEMSRHTDSIAKLFRIFGEIGAGRLPELAKWFGELTDRFADFLDTAQKTGRLDIWIETALQRIKDLGRATANLSSLLTGLARAADDATPGDALGNLADALGRAAKVVNGAHFQKNLVGVLKAAHESMENIARISGPSFEKFMESLSRTLQTTMPKAGEAIGTMLDGVFSLLSDPAVEKGWENLVDGIARGVKKLRPMFPVLAKKTGAFYTLIGELSDTLGGTFAAAVETLTPLLTITLEVLTKIVDILGDIPKPLLKVGIALGAAYLAWSKVNLAAQSFKLLGGNLTGSLGSMRLGFQGIASDLGVMATSWLTAGAASERETKRMTDAKERLRGKMNALRGAAKNLAGPAGIAGLTLSLSSANPAIELFGSVASGALLGFSMGGPLGAAIGGIGGLAAAFLSTKKKIVEDATPDLVRSNLDLAGSFDKITAAASDATRSLVTQELERKGLLTQAPKIGLSQKTLVDAILGEEKARKKVNDAIKKYRNVGGALATDMQIAQSDAAVNLGAALMGLKENFKGEAEEAKRAILANRGWIGSLKGLPKDLVIKIRQDGLQGSLADAETLARKWRGLDKKQIKILLRAEGLAVTKQNIDAVAQAAKEGARKLGEAGKDGGKKYRDNLKTELDRSRSTSQNSIRGMVTGLIGIANPLMRTAGNRSGNQYAAGTANSIDAGDVATGRAAVRIVRAAIQAAKDFDPWGKAKPIGSFISAGITKGISGGLGSMIATGISVVGQTIQAMKDRAQVKSPSRLTMEIGDYMGQGLVIGLQPYGKSLARVSTDLIDSLASGLSNGSEDVVGSGLLDGLQKSRQPVLSEAATLAEEIAETFRSVMSQVFTATLQGEFETATGAIAAADFQSQVAGLERHVTSASRANEETSSKEASTVQIDNITIPLEDLEQLKSLEDFLDLLRVYIRQG